MIILFVCQANIVRSYMAEAILKEKLRRQQIKEVTVLSAGLMDMQGAPADPTATQLLLDGGFPLSEHYSKLLDRNMVEKADWIIVMETSQKMAILDNYPEVRNKVYLLKTFSKDYNGIDMEIRDPYRQSIYLYRLCFSEIYLALDGFIKCI
jgi:protein-tyrosine-phosphatase